MHTTTNVILYVKQCTNRALLQVSSREQKPTGISAAAEKLIKVLHPT